MLPMEQKLTGKDNQKAEVFKPVEEVERPCLLNGRCWKYNVLLVC